MERPALSTRPPRPARDPLARLGVWLPLALAAVPLAVLAVFFLLPLGGMLQRGLWPEGRLDLAGVGEVLSRGRTARAAWFTLWTSALGTLIAVLAGLPVAHLLHRRRFPGRGLLRALIVVPFVLPTLVVGAAFRRLLAPDGLLGPLGWDASPAAVVLGLVFFNVAVVVRTVGVAWEGLDRRPAEAAAALGAGPLTVLRTVTLPALRPAILAAAGVVFLFCATAFGVVLTLGGVRYASIETEIYLLTTVLYDLPGAAALSLLQVLVVLTLLLLGGRLARGGGAGLGGATGTGGTIGTAGRVVARAPRPGRRDTPVVLAATTVLVFLALPVQALVTGALRVDGAWSLARVRDLAGRGAADDGLLPVTVGEAWRHSVQTAVDATWISVLLGLLVALSLTRTARGRAARRVRAGLDLLFLLPLGVSAVTIGFGLLVTLGRPPLDLRTWPLLVPLAQALVALPIVVRTLLPVLAAVDDRQRQAASSLGAGPLRVLLTVDAAVLWRPLLAGAGFAFAVSLGEFGATSFVARADNPTLPLVIFRLLGRPGADNFGLAMAASLLLALTVAAAVLLGERLRVPALGGRVVAR